MVKKILMQKDLYDFYSFKIPAVLLFGKKRKKYLTVELEKRHPCFSNNLCFESKVSVSRKGFYENAVVISKNALQEIKKANSKKFLGIEEHKGIYFIGQKRKFFFWLAVAGILACCLGGCVAGVRAVNPVPSFIDPGITGNTERLEEQYQPVSRKINFLIEKIKVNNGSISMIEWKAADFAESIRISVAGVYSEQLAEIGKEVVISPVTYVNGMPSMVVEMTDRKNAVVHPEENPMEFNYAVPFIREVLIADKAKIKEETPFLVRFELFNDETTKRKVISQIIKILKEKNIPIVYLNCKRITDEQLEIQMEFGKVAGYQWGIDIPVLEQALELFSGNNNKNFQLENQNVYGKKQINKMPEVKIGEVKYADGSKTVFYKTPEGKTIRKKEF